MIKTKSLLISLIFLQPVSIIVSINSLFNKSKTKKTKYVASVRILNKVKKFTKTPTIAIGGINAVNYKNLLLNNANFLAISGYIWKNKKYKPLQAIERLK